MPPSSPPCSTKKMHGKRALEVHQAKITAASLKHLLPVYIFINYIKNNALEYFTLSRYHLFAVEHRTIGCRFLTELASSPLCKSKTSESRGFQSPNPLKQPVFHQASDTSFFGSKGRRMGARTSRQKNFLHANLPVGRVVSQRKPHPRNACTEDLSND